MGYYLKVTGRGYVKAIDTSSSSVDHQEKFSKQLTLATCMSSATEAETYKQTLVKRLTSEVASAESAYKVGLKISSFPEMFSSKKQVIDFIHKNGITKKTHGHPVGYLYSGMYEKLTNYFTDNHWKKYEFREAMEKFCCDSKWDGFNAIEEAYKSITNSLKLIGKAKVVELENTDVTITKAMTYKPSYKTSMKSDTVGYSTKTFCSCCGASIPGAEYLSLGNQMICPYCLVKFSKKASANVDQLGDTIAKAYKTAIFVKSL